MSRQLHPRVDKRTLQYGLLRYAFHARNMIHSSCRIKGATPYRSVCRFACTRFGFSKRPANQGRRSRPCCPSRESHRRHCLSFSFASLSLPSRYHSDCGCKRYGHSHSSYSTRLCLSGHVEISEASHQSIAPPRPFVALGRTSWLRPRLPPASSRRCQLYRTSTSHPPRISTSPSGPLPPAGLLVPHPPRVIALKRATISLCASSTRRRGEQDSQTRMLMLSLRI